MRVLVLGGTGFLSSAVVRAAADAGHDVTAVTRGRMAVPSAVPSAASTGATGACSVRFVRGDRDDVASLRAAVASAWAGAADPPPDAGDGSGGAPPAALPDAVIDVCGYTVAGAHAAAEVLGGVAAYVYVSSISAYAGWPPGPVPDESAPTWPATADLTDYGPMKAESERVLERATDGRALLARAGLIVGPGDRTRRLTRWLHRFATQDRVVVPDALGQPVAVVDARDLASWLVRAAEERLSGPVTATGPAGMTTYGGLLEACRSAVAAGGATPGTPVVVDEARLLAAGVEPWRDLPFWLPRETARTAWDVGTDRARALGLASRPVEESVRDTWRWMGTAGLEHPDEPPALTALTELLAEPAG